MKLTERVRVITGTGTRLAGCLFVGADGLPEVRVKEDAVEGEVWQALRPSQFPDAWNLLSPTCGELYQAWREIEAVQMRLRVAQREAEDEAQREPDDIDAAKADMETRGEL